MNVCFFNMVNMVNIVLAFLCQGFGEARMPNIKDVSRCDRMSPSPFEGSVVSFSISKTTMR